MNSIANNIKLRLSLREPLQEALDIVAQLSSDLSLNKVPDNEEEALVFLKSELDKVKNSFTTCFQGPVVVQKNVIAVLGFPYHGYIVR